MTSWPEFVDKARELDSAGVVVRIGDEVLQWWDDAGPRLVECMSVTKFVVATAIGLTLQPADLRLPLRTWIDEWANDERGELTPAQVLTHTTGLAVSPASAVYQAESVQALILATELTGRPGEFAYNNVAFHLAGLVAERASGQRLHELVGQGLFGPLGITEWDWQVDRQGFALCMAGLQLKPDDLAAVAGLHLSAGWYRERQVLSADWLAAVPPAARGQVGLGCFAQFDGEQRVGFGHDGYLGQWATVQPEAGLVGVRVRTSQDNERDLWPDFPGDVRRLAR